MTRATKGAAWRRPAERDAALREAAVAREAAAADRHARAAEADARHSAEVAAGEARARLGRRSRRCATNTRPRLRRCAATTSAPWRRLLRQATDDEARRAAGRERAVAEEIALLRAAERDARTELAAAHDHELQAECAGAERHLAELRATLNDRLDAATRERDAARTTLETLRDEVHALRVRTEVAERLAAEREAALQVAQRDLTALIAQSTRSPEDDR